MNDTAPSPSDKPPLRKRLQATGHFARQAWALARPYFHSDERWAARGLLAAIVALNLGTVYMLVLLNDWNRVFYDALQNKDQPVFWRELGHFCWLAAVYMLIAVYKFYLTQSLEIRWRAWLTRHFMGRWLADQTFYRLELQRYTQPAGQNGPDNPDQRMQEDLQLFTGYSVSLSMGLLNAVVTLVSFVGILWTLSGAFSLRLGGQEFVIPGFMVWMAVIYCAVGSWLAHLIGRPLAGLNFSQQQKEANFRHHLIRVREHSEAIALDRGAAAESQALQGRFSAVLANAWLLLRAQKRLTWFTSGFAQAATVFPFIIAAPRFFSGAIQLGELMQIASAFGRVQDSLSWLVENYDRLAGWQATTRRLTSFEDSLRGSHETTHTPPPAPPIPGGDPPSASVALSIPKVALRLPNGQALLNAEGLRLQAGQTVLLQGPSGCGKSTLMRAVAGIWPWQDGHISHGPDWMFLPQKPYLPQGSLRQALTYPGLLGEVSDDTLKDALHQAHLPHMVQRLDDEQAWDQCLSGGEQQRLALARVLVRRPRWVFADEVTSALDETTQARLYQTLMTMVQAQHGGLVSITHQPALWPLHNTVWQVVIEEPGAAPHIKAFAA